MVILSGLGVGGNLILSIILMSDQTLMKAIFSDLHHHSQIQTRPLQSFTTPYVATTNQITGNTLALDWALIG